MYWFNDEHLCRINKDRVVIRLYDTNDKFIDSMVFPSEYFPLHSNDFSVFNCENCVEVKNEKILKVFDAVKWELGRCYTNAENLYNALIKNGIDAKMYSGWFLIGTTTAPTHHSWVVCGNSVLDLSSDLAELNKFVENKIQRSIDTVTYEEANEYISEFYSVSKKWRNSERCKPVGIPNERVMYIGCPCDKDTALRERAELSAKFPDHISVPIAQAGKYSNVQEQIINKEKNLWKQKT